MMIGKVFYQFCRTLGNNDNGVIPRSVAASEVRTAPARPHPAIEEPGIA